MKRKKSKKKTPKSSKSLQKFMQRHKQYKDNPTVLGFTLKGIRKNKDVMKYAKRHKVRIVSNNAYYPKNRKMGR